MVPLTSTKELTFTVDYRADPLLEIFPRQEVDRMFIIHEVLITENIMFVKSFFA